MSKGEPWPETVTARFSDCILISRLHFSAAQKSDWGLHITCSVGSISGIDGMRFYQLRVKLLRVTALRIGLSRQAVYIALRCLNRREALCSNYVELEIFRFCAYQMYSVTDRMISNLCSDYAVMQAIRLYAGKEGYMNQRQNKREAN